MKNILEIAYDNTIPDDKEQDKRKQAYEAIFNTTDGELVLKDLIQFTKFIDSGITDSSIINGYDAGLRAVMMHVIRMLIQKQQPDDQ